MRITKNKVNVTVAATLLLLTGCAGTSTVTPDSLTARRISGTLIIGTETTSATAVLAGQSLTIDGAPAKIVSQNPLRADGVAADGKPFEFVGD